MNIPTMVILTIIGVIFLTILVSEIKKKRRGEGSCSCGCSGCANADFCHTKKE